MNSPYLAWELIGQVCQSALCSAWADGGYARQHCALLRLTRLLTPCVGCVGMRLHLFFIVEACWLLKPLHHIFVSPGLQQWWRLIDADRSRQQNQYEQLQLQIVNPSVEAPQVAPCLCTPFVWSPAVWGGNARLPACNPRCQLHDSNTLQPPPNKEEGPC